MKRIFLTILSLMILCTFVSCKGKEKIEYGESDIIDAKENGVAEIIIKDDKNNEIETMTLTYEKDVLVKVEYLINEEDEDTLDIDRDELNKLSPSKLVNSGLALYAEFEDDTLEERFLNFQKRYVNDYIRELEKENPNYTFQVTYSEKE